MAPARRAEHLGERIRRLRVERERLRDGHADRAALEANRLQLVYAQQALARVAGELYRA